GDFILAGLGDVRREEHGLVSLARATVVIGTVADVGVAAGVVGAEGPGALGVNLVGVGGALVDDDVNRLAAAAGGTTHEHGRVRRDVVGGVGVAHFQVAGGAGLEVIDAERLPRQAGLGLIPLLQIGRGRSGVGDGIGHVGRSALMLGPGDKHFVIAGLDDGRRVADGLVALIGV